jgi:hypothetical protein
MPALGTEQAKAKGTESMPFDGSQYVTASPVTQMLMEARQQVELGWCQHSMRQRGSVCMIGALEIDDYTQFIGAEALLLEAIGSLGHSHSSVAAFNDDLGRTKNEVLKVYDRAIEKSMTL